MIVLLTFLIFIALSIAFFNYLSTPPYYLSDEQKFAFYNERNKKIQYAVEAIVTLSICIYLSL